jgi:hypothetical protein
MRPPGTANSSSLCSAKRETILEKMGTHFTFPSASCGWGGVGRGIVCVRCVSVQGGALAVDGHLGCTRGARREGREERGLHGVGAKEVKRALL